MMIQSNSTTYGDLLVKPLTFHDRVFYDSGNRTFRIEPKFSVQPANVSRDLDTVFQEISSRLATGDYVNLRPSQQFMLFENLVCFHEQAKRTKKVANIYFKPDPHAQLIKLFDSLKGNLSALWEIAEVAEQNGIAILRKRSRGLEEFFCDGLKGRLMCSVDVDDKPIYDVFVETIIRTIETGLKTDPEAMAKCYKMTGRQLTNYRPYDCQNVIQMGLAVQVRLFQQAMHQPSLVSPKDIYWFFPILDQLASQVGSRNVFKFMVDVGCCFSFPHGAVSNIVALLSESQRSNLLKQMYKDSQNRDLRENAFALAMYLPEVCVTLTLDYVDAPLDCVSNCLLNRGKASEEELMMFQHFKTRTLDKRRFTGESAPTIYAHINYCPQDIQDLVKGIKARQPRPKFL